MKGRKPSMTYAQRPPSISPISLELCVYILRRSTVEASSLSRREKKVQMEKDLIFSL